MTRRWSGGLLMGLCLILASVAGPGLLAAQIEQLKLRASDGLADDRFGLSVAASVDTLVIGADGVGDLGRFSGAAYVFVRAGGLWTEQAKLLASDGVEFDYFGVAVSVADDTAVVGARGVGDQGAFSGAAYVFVRSGAAWTEQAKLLASDGAEFEDFGWSVAVDGDTAVVGAYRNDALGDFSGAAYVFVRSGEVWTEQAKLVASDGGPADEFGTSVAIDGDTIIVGSPGDDDLADASGAAYIFERSGDLWTESAKLLASDVTDSNAFGRSVAIDGDSIAIGARKGGFQVRPGAVFIFVRSANVWTEQAKLQASDGTNQDYFAQAVSIAGDTVAVGAHGVDDLGNSSGAAYLFARSGDVWTEKAKLLASDGAERDYFGKAVAVAGDIAVIGAPGQGLYQQTFDRGAAYLFGVTVFADGFESGDGSLWSEQEPLP